MTFDAPETPSPPPSVLAEVRHSHLRRYAVTVALILATAAAWGYWLGATHAPWVAEAALAHHGGPGTVVALSDDAMVAASAGPDRRVIVYNLAAGDELYHLDGLPEAPTLLRFSPGREVLALAFAGRPASCLRLSDKSLVTVGPASQGAIALAVSHDTTRLATAQPDGTIHIWNLATGTETCTFQTEEVLDPFAEEPQSGLARLDFTPDDRAILAYGSSVGFPLVFNANTGRTWFVKGTEGYNFSSEFMFGGRSASLEQRRVQFTLSEEGENQTPFNMYCWFVTTYRRESVVLGSGWTRLDSDRSQAPLRVTQPSYLAFGATLSRVVVAQPNGDVYSVRPMITQDWSRSPLLLPAGVLTLLLIAWLLYRGFRLLDPIAPSMAPGTYPPALRIVAVLILVSGVLAAIGIVYDMFHMRANFNLALLNVFIGWAMLRGRESWRRFVLFQTWCGVGAAGLLGGILFTDHPSPKITWSGEPVGAVPLALAVPVILALLAVIVWVGWVLTRPDIRAFLTASRRLPTPQDTDTA